MYFLKHFTFFFRAIRELQQIEDQIEAIEFNQNRKPFQGNTNIIISQGHTLFYIQNS